MMLNEDNQDERGRVQQMLRNINALERARAADCCRGRGPKRQGRNWEWKEAKNKEEMKIGRGAVRWQQESNLKLQSKEIDSVTKHPQKVAFQVQPS
jgi:hypothetical protein